MRVISSSGRPKEVTSLARPTFRHEVCRVASPGLSWTDGRRAIGSGRREMQMGMLPLTSS